MYLNTVHICLVVLSFLPRWAYGAMMPAEIRNACFSLGTATFSLKDFVVQMNSTSKASTSKTSNPKAKPITDICSEFDTLFDQVVSSIGCLAGSRTLLQPRDQQIVHEGFTFFAQGLLELMDALSRSAGSLVRSKKHEEFTIPADIRALSGVVDAYLYSLIGLFPTTTPFYFQANIQKSQVDTHFRRAIRAFHALDKKIPKDDKPDFDEHDPDEHDRDGHDRDEHDRDEHDRDGHDRDEHDRDGHDHDDDDVPEEDIPDWNQDTTNGLRKVELKV